MGYNLGTQAAAEVVAGSRVQSIIEGLSILGLFMMGILAGNYVKVTSPLKFTLSGKEFVIQDLLNKIVPGLLPLLVVMSIYLYFTKRGLKVTKALIGLTLILGILGFFNIL